MNVKTLYIELISLYEYIQLKSKIKTLEVHQSLPWVVFSDLENNIMIFDVIDKKPVRAFNIQNFFQEQVVIKDLKFFNINDKQYINNYDLNEIKKIRGIPFHLRSNLLIITLEKHVCFYSYITQNFIKTITPIDIEQKLPVKCEVFNYMYVIIQTSDGCLVIWNILDWGMVKVINKTNLSKPVANFMVVSTAGEGKYITAANTNGNLFLIDISKKDIMINKLELDKTEHDATVTFMDFNPLTNILVTISKNSIYLVDLKNIKNNKKIPNFQYFKSEKPYGVLTNLNNNFPKSTYFIYGKTSTISAMDINLELLKNRKLDSKDGKNYISNNFDLETQNLPKISDRQFKIYIAKFLNHTTDFLILGTNKGVVFLKFNQLCKPEIEPCTKLMEINSENKMIFYAIQNGTQLMDVVYTNNIGNNYNLSTNYLDNLKMNPPKTTTIISQAFDNKAMTTNFFNRFKIGFSYEANYMSTVDNVNNIYTIYQLTINEELKYSFKGLKYGKCAGDLEWCPYDDIFAVTLGTISQMNNKSTVSTDKNRLSSVFKYSFALTVYRISGETISSIYVIDEIPCHRIFGGHYISILSNLVTTSKEEDFTFPGVFTNFNYNPGNQLVLNFYYWTDKMKLNLYLSEEPVKIVSSSDLQFLIVIFLDKYILYTITIDSATKTYGLSPVNVYYYKLVDGVIYENFVFVFLTDKGVYFHLLNEDNAYPTKLLKASDEMNMYHLKISKKIKDKETIYTKKLLPTKILGIFNSDNILVLSGSFNEIIFKSIDNILFKIIFLIIKRKFGEIHQLLTILEKKYIKSVLAIFKYYFNNNEEIIRNIFSAGGNSTILADIVEHFQLYRQEDCFLPDFLNNPLLSTEDRNRVDKHMRSLLVRNLLNNNEKAIDSLYQFANKSSLTFEILCSKYIDPNTFLKSMLVHNRNFESFVFNENYKLNGDMGDKILSRAYERINQAKMNK